jgi:hypothetical protein
MKRKNKNWLKLHKLPCGHRDSDRSDNPDDLMLECQSLSLSVVFHSNTESATGVRIIYVWPNGSVLDVGREWVPSLYQHMSGSLKIQVVLTE